MLPQHWGTSGPVVLTTGVLTTGLLTTDDVTTDNDPPDNQSCVYLSSALPGFGFGGHLSSWNGLLGVGWLVIDVSPDAWGCLALQTEYQLKISHVQPVRKTTQCCSNSDTSAKCLTHW